MMCTRFASLYGIDQSDRSRQSPAIFKTYRSAASGEVCPAIEI